MTLTNKIFRIFQKSIISITIIIIGIGFFHIMNKEMSSFDFWALALINGLGLSGFFMFLSVHLFELYEAIMEEKNE